MLSAPVPVLPGSRFALLLACLLAAPCAHLHRPEALAQPVAGAGPVLEAGERREQGAGRQAGAGWERWERVGRLRLPEKTLSVNLPVLWGIRFFQMFVSPVDGPSCEFYPSCSAYGLQAVRKHGLLLGVPMATERIVRNHHPEDALRYPLVERRGEFYYLDPPEANDFWRAGGR